MVRDKVVEAVVGYVTENPFLEPYNLEWKKDEKVYGKSRHLQVCPGKDDEVKLIAFIGTSRKVRGEYPRLECEIVDPKNGIPEAIFTPYIKDLPIEYYDRYEEDAQSFDIWSWYGSLPGWMKESTKYQRPKETTEYKHFKYLAHMRTDDFALVDEDKIKEEDEETREMVQLTLLHAECLFCELDKLEKGVRITDGTIYVPLFYPELMQTGSGLPSLTIKWDLLEPYLKQDSV